MAKKPRSFRRGWIPYYDHHDLSSIRSSCQKIWVVFPKYWNLKDPIRNIARATEILSEFDPHQDILIQCGHSELYGLCLVSLRNRGFDVFKRALWLSNQKKYAVDPIWLSPPH